MVSPRKFPGLPSCRSPPHFRTGSAPGPMNPPALSRRPTPPKPPPPPSCRRRRRRRGRRRGRGGRPPRRREMSPPSPSPATHMLGHARARVHTLTLSLISCQYGKAIDDSSPPRTQFFQALHYCDFLPRNTPRVLSPPLSFV